jgi:hypothetical protein
MKESIDLMVRLRTAQNLRALNLPFLEGVSDAYLNYLATSSKLIHALPGGTAWRDVSPSRSASRRCSHRTAVVVAGSDMASALCPAGDAVGLLLFPVICSLWSAVVCSLWSAAVCSLWSAVGFSLCYANGWLSVVQAR